MTAEKKEPPNRHGRASRPFAAVDAAHTVVRAAEQLGYDLSDADAFLQRAQLVEYGLSAEIEFAALLRWLGWCPLVHRLGEDVLCDKNACAWHVPDLFANFERNNVRCSAVIEVKTTEDDVLTFNKDYIAKMQAYADLVGEPLLIAWRPRRIGFWILFDPNLAKPVGPDKVQVDFGTAIKNDLMSVLAGDYYLVPAKGAGLRFEANRIGEKKHTDDGYEAVFQVSQAFVHDAKGDKVDDVPQSLFWAILSVVRDHDEVQDDTIVQSFLASGSLTRAQLVLRTAAGFSLKEGERIHWKEVGRDFDSVLRSNDLLSDAQANFKTFVSYVLYQQPQEIPSFLPKNWPGRELPSNSGGNAAGKESA